jgi:hypothetical protein
MTVKGISVNVTSSHPIATSNGWRPASRLSPGDEIVTRNGQDKVSQITEKHEVVKVYDVTVSPCEVFYANGVLVHNKRPTPAPNVKDIATSWVGLDENGVDYCRIELSADGTGLLAVCSRSGDDNAILHRVSVWKIEGHTLTGKVEPIDRPTVFDSARIEGWANSWQLDISIIGDQWQRRISFYRESEISRRSVRANERIERYRREDAERRDAPSR